LPSVSFRRTVLRTIGGLALAFGLIGGVSRVCMREARPLPQREAICTAELCEWDFKSDLNLRNNHPNFGLEKNCGAQLLGSRLLDDHTIRYRIKVAGITPENPCDIKLILNGQKITFADELSR